MVMMNICTVPVLDKSTGQISALYLVICCGLCNVTQFCMLYHVFIMSKI